MSEFIASSLREGVGCLPTYQVITPFYGRFHALTRQMRREKADGQRDANTMVFIIITCRKGRPALNAERNERFVIIALLYSSFVEMDAVISRLDVADSKEKINVDQLKFGGITPTAFASEIHWFSSLLVFRLKCGKRSRYIAWQCY